MSFRSSAVRIGSESLVASSSRRWVVAPRVMAPQASTSSVVQQKRYYNPFESILPAFLSRKRSKPTPTPSSSSTIPTDSTSPTTTPEAVGGESSDSMTGTEDIFRQMELVREAAGEKKSTGVTQHKYSTARFKISPRKLNALAHQISGLPIGEAILQMQFSEKRASGRIKSTLALGRGHAVDKGLEGGRLVVAESWVDKGRTIKRIDIKGRARFGIKEHQQARLHFILREGKTKAELLEEKRREMLGRIRGAGVVREERRVINAGTGGWRW